MGVPIHSVSAVTGEGLDELDAYLRAGADDRPARLIGIGKSTLINRIAGKRAARDLRDERSRARAAHDLPSRARAASFRGRLLLDTPGMRELQLWAGEEVLDTTFSEIAQLAAECRFSDCSHHERAGLRDSAGARATARSRRIVGSSYTEAPARDPGARDPQGRTASLRGAEEVGEVLEGPDERRSIDPGARRTS